MEIVKPKVSGLEVVWHSLDRDLYAVVKKRCNECLSRFMKSSYSSLLIISGRSRTYSEDVSEEYKRFY